MLARVSLYWLLLLHSHGFRKELGSFLHFQDLNYFSIDQVIA
jgi:hypothetical protein